MKKGEASFTNKVLVQPDPSNQVLVKEGFLREGAQVPTDQHTTDVHSPSHDSNFQEFD